MITKRHAWVAGFCLLLTGCTLSLSQNLDERQADDVVVMLGQQGIKAEKVRAKDGSWEVNVERSAQTSAAQIMQAYDLPRRNRPSLGDIFPGGSLLPSETEERIRYQYALSQELSGTIERIDGVLTARVQVAIPEKDPKRAVPAKPSASAMIRYRSDQRMDLLKPQIKRLIADSLTGGSPDNVDLLMLPVYPIAQDEGLQEVRTYAGLRYRASEWARVVILTGLPWLVAFLLLLVMIKAMGKSEGTSILELGKKAGQWIRQRRGNDAGMNGSAGPSYGSRGMAGLAKRQPRPPAKD